MHLQAKVRFLLKKLSEKADLHTRHCIFAKKSRFGKSFRAGFQVIKKLSWGFVRTTKENKAIFGGLCLKTARFLYQTSIFFAISVQDGA